MPLPVLLACAAVAASIPLLWWSVSSARSADHSARRNLAQGLTTSGDLRELVLSRSATERSLRPPVSYTHLTLPTTPYV